MRVAQRMVTRNYMKSLNSSLSNQAASLDRSTTGLKFKKLSENVSDGMRAMRIQEERIRCEQQLTNVENIQLEFKSVDSNLDSIDSILRLVQEKVEMAMSESYGDTARQVLAQEITQVKSQVVQFCNAQFAGKYLFSGYNNATPPFDVDEFSGKLTYNGIEVDQIYKSNGQYCYKDSSDVEHLVPYTGNIYMDIGQGLQMANGQPDPRTAFQVSFDGLALLGYGADVTGEKNGTTIANNVYDVLTQLETAVKNYDINSMDDLYTHFVKLNDKMRMSRTELGTRVNYLDRTQIRLENDIDNLGEMESNLISVDAAEETINMKMYEYVWLATLQLGSYILPTSLLDYLR